jgi:hypothetical protein
MEFMDAIPKGSCGRQAEFGLLLPCRRSEERENRLGKNKAGTQVHEFGTDPYWIHGGGSEDPVDFVGTCSRQAKKICDEMAIRCQIWIQGFKIPEGREEEVRTAIRTALDCGVRNLAVWGFDACKHITSIAPDNPDKVWSIVREEFVRAGSNSAKRRLRFAHGSPHPWPPLPIDRSGLEREQA